jgi:glucans biosynthesis protein C
MSAATPSVAAGERLHALDAVRGFALLAGIVFHASFSFLPLPGGTPLWIVSDSHPSLALGVMFHVLHIFRMATFFLIAGFFARMMIERRGVVGFVRNRATRIALPLVVGWPLLFASIVAVTIWAAVTAAHGRPLPPAPKYPGFPTFPLTHLWFLYVLLWLYAGALALRALAGLGGAGGPIGAAVDRIVRFLTTSPAGPALLAIPAAIALYVTPDWRPWFGVPTPDSSLLPNLAASIAFASAFGFGWLVRRQPGLLGAWRNRWPLDLTVAIAATAAELAIQGAAPSIAIAPPGWTKAALAVLYALAVWSWTFAVIGVALRFLHRESPARRYVADASYWLYLVHLPVVAALQVVVAPLELPGEVKLALILAVAFPVLFGSYQLFVRHSFIGRILNGPRPRRTRVPGVAAPATA